MTKAGSVVASVT